MTEPPRWVFRAYLVVALSLCVLMPSSDSLWIDEAQTWKSAVIPDFGSWFHALRNNPFSEALMPLGMFVAWLSAKLIGTSEWQLRAINILWTWLSVIAFWRIGKAFRAPWAPLLFAVQPFVWFYANEARPYSMQMACGAWLLAGLVIGIEQRSFTLVPLLMIASAGFLLVGTTLFGIITLAAVILVVFVLVWKKSVTISRSWVAIGISLFCGCLLLGMYYVGALRRGAEGARLWSVGAANLAFSLYEFGGFAGLGPPRDEIRELAQNGGISNALRATLPYAAALGCLAFLLTVSICRSLKASITARSNAAVVVLAWMATVFLALAAHFPFWGRHLAPTLPFYVAILTVGAVAGRGQSTRVSSWLIGGLTVILLGSSLRLRFAESHRKDDYRSATAIARNAAALGELVWWAADEDAATYYGLTFSQDQGSTSGILRITKSTDIRVPGRPTPGIIFLSKPDLYDETHSLRDLLSALGYKPDLALKSFTVWRAPK